MIRRSSHTLIVWFVVWDLVSVSVCWLGAYLIRFRSGWFPISKAVPDFASCWMSLPLILILTLVAFRMAGQYRVTRLRRFREELTAVFQGTALLALFILATIFYQQTEYQSRGAMLLFSVATLCSVLACRRLTWNAVHSLRRRGFNQSLAIVVGTGRVARHASRALRHASWMGIRNLGFVEDRVTRWSTDLDILGSIDDLPRLIDRYRVAHVFIALPMNRYHEARRIFGILSDRYVEVQLVADVPALAGLSLTTTSMDGLPIIGLRESPHFGLNIVVKRAMDVGLASLAVVLLAPLLGLIAGLIRLTSPGPVFYRQPRCSLNGRTFSMLKFRSMREDADSGGEQMTAIRDPRITPLGKFLRKTSLDELPQFLNVLGGSMSIVGPRPEQPKFIREFAQSIPNYMARHSVKCGITGWAQVNGWRGNTSLRKRLQYDLYYITHWNPLFDLRIMVLTFWKGLIHRNAY